MVCVEEARDFLRSIDEEAILGGEDPGLALVAFFYDYFGFITLVLFPHCWPIIIIIIIK